MNAAAHPRTPAGRRAVLAVLLFLQHGIGGLWLPILGLHFAELGFSVGALFLTLPIATVLSPWLAGHFADRVIASERYLLLTHLVLAVLLWSLAHATSYVAVWLLMLGVAMAMMPSLAVGNALVLRHLVDPTREYGGVRIFGTLSWVVLGAWMGLWLTRPAWLPGAGDARVADGLRFAAAFSLAAAALCLIVPPSPPARGAGRGPLRAAWTAIANRDGLALLIASVLLAQGLGFVYPLAQLFLRDLGLPTPWIAPALSLGQVSELAAFFTMGPLVARWGMKTVFAVGAAAWVLRFAVWTWGGWLPLVIAAIGLHGFAFAWVVGLGQIYIHRVAPLDARASAQTLHAVIVMGVSGVASQLWVAACTEWFEYLGPDGVTRIDFHATYLGPTVVSLVALVVFLAGFSPPRRVAAAPASPPSPAT